MAEGRIEIDTGTSELLCEIRDRVALITLNRPEARNALSDHLTPALRRMIKQCGDDPNVGALLISGAGNAFCAGGDVRAWGTMPTGRNSVRRARCRPANQAAHPDGCAGGGESRRLQRFRDPRRRRLALALACDIRIASESAIMATGYARIGLTGITVSRGC